MSKPFFKESDHETIHPDPSSQKIYDWISIPTANRLLRERGQPIAFNFGVMLSRPLAVASAICSPCHPLDIGEYPRTHQALLINIEKIETSDTAEKILKDLIKYQACLDEQNIRCSDAIPELSARARKLIGGSK